MFNIKKQCKRIVILTIFLTFSKLYAEQRTVTFHYNSGSGFFISSDGYIVTNAHVINKCHQNTIYMLTDAKNNKKTLLTQIAIDEENDLAILKAPNSNHNYLAFSVSHNKLKENDTIYMAGYPNGSHDLNFKQSEFRRYDTKQIGSLLFNNIAHQGNSGGALINDAGHLVGVVRGMVSLHRRMTYYFDDEKASTDIYNKQETFSSAISLDKLENLTSHYNIKISKVNSDIKKGSSDIFNEAQKYMVHILCN